MYKFFLSTNCIIFYFAVSMASSSSCSPNIKMKSSLIDGDVLWMQDKHVSQHIWDEKVENYKLDELFPRIKV